MKILFSISYFSPYVSGLTIYVKRLARLLVNQHESVVLCMRHDRDLPEEEMMGKTKIVRANWIARISKGFLSLDWIAKSYRWVGWADVVIVNLPQAEGWITALLGKLLGKKVIAIYHCEVNMANKFIQGILEAANWTAMYFADRIVTYTKDYGDASKLLNSFKEKVDYIYPPVEKPVIDRSLKKKLRGKIGKADKIVGLAARLAAEKGIEYLLEAMRMIKGDVKLVVAGPVEPVGEEKYREKIMELVEQQKKRIVFLGTIDEEKMGSFYSLIDVLVLPSINSTEAFGMVQLEAMMMGVPVVASDLPGVRVPIEKTGMGVVAEPRNSEGLAKAISEVIKNRKKYILTGRARKVFDIKKVVEFYECLVLESTNK